MFSTRLWLHVTIVMVTLAFLAPGITTGSAAQTDAKVLRVQQWSIPTSSIRRKARSPTSSISWR